MNKILGLAFLLSGCYTKQEKAALIIPSKPTSSIVAPINYDSCKKAIAIIKRQAKTNWNKTSQAEKEKYFTNAVTNTIVPAWIGTKWDFNGTTQVPQQGKIACGYFVTTVLRDAGLPLARVKLAQYASQQMIHSLVRPKFVKLLCNTSMENFMTYLKLQGFGLYIIGLDNHTGFIFNDGQDVWFIHSTYIGTGGVQKEKAATNTILQNSKYKIVGKLSADAEVLDKWIKT